MATMEVQAFAIEAIENQDFIVCAVENGGGVFRMPLPMGKQGESLKALINDNKASVRLRLEKNYDGSMNIVSISAVK